MTIFRLGVGALRQHRRITLVMALAAGIPLMLYFLLGAYRAGLQSRYAEHYEDFLVVQVSGSLGEFYGSRMPASVGDALREANLSLVVPQIHTVVGTTTENAVLLRGIPLDSYSRVEEFTMISGRPLMAGDAPRLAMIGARLAEERQLLPGDVIPVRGRDFQVAGIFDADTYASNEVWISLEDAQALLGWGTDVSVYVIPNTEAYQEGDRLPGGISIVRKGDSGAALIAEWEPFFKLLTHITGALGIAAAVALASILWRLAWLQRRELAILRSIGFKKGSLAGFLLVQGSRDHAGWLPARSIGSGRIGAIVHHQDRRHLDPGSLRQPGHPDQFYLCGAHQPGGDIPASLVAEPFQLNHALKIRIIGGIYVEQKMVSGCDQHFNIG